MMMGLLCPGCGEEMSRHTHTVRTLQLAESLPLADTSTSKEAPTPLPGPHSSWCILLAQIPLSDPALLHISIPSQRPLPLPLYRIFIRTRTQLLCRTKLGQSLLLPLALLASSCAIAFICRVILAGERPSGGAGGFALGALCSLGPVCFA